MKRARQNRPDDCPYVGKGGLKLRFALEHFEVNVEGLTAADLGCQVGGFTDCLLEKGARKVYTVDTAYGVLDWKLRNDQRVEVYERTNALHWNPPEKLDLVTIDLGWTGQEKSLPRAAGMIKPGARVLSLVKPQYEVEKDWLVRGVLPGEKFEDALKLVRGRIPKKLTILNEAPSPYLGSGGNRESWLLLTGEDS